MKASEEWQRVVASKLSEFSQSMQLDQSAESLSAFVNLTQSAILDLVVAYDRHGALGGREWLEENADPAQLYTAVRQMAEVAFPFVTDLKAALALLPGLVNPSSSSTSTNGHSPNGDLMVMTSSPGSTESN
jgi:hypothetical protein